MEAADRRRGSRACLERQSGLTSAYACERSAFGQPIGTYQAISTSAGGSQYRHRRRQVSRLEGDSRYRRRQGRCGRRDFAGRCGGTSILRAALSPRRLHTFGGYGLTTEYDIHLYNLRAKAWPLIFGDPARLLEEAGRRLYSGEQVALPDAGAVTIDFDLGEEAQSLAKEVHAFFETYVDAGAASQSALFLRRARCRRASQARRGGLLFPSWPKEWGGRQAPPYAMNALHQAWEEVGWSSHAISTTRPGRHHDPACSAAMS